MLDENKFFKTRGTKVRDGTYWRDGLYVCEVVETSYFPTDNPNKTGHKCLIKCRVEEVDTTGFSDDIAPLSIGEVGLDVISLDGQYMESRMADVRGFVTAALGVPDDENFNKLVIAKAKKEKMKPMDLITHWLNSGQFVGVPIGVVARSKTSTKKDEKGNFKVYCNKGYYLLEEEDE